MVSDNLEVFHSFSEALDNFILIFFRLTDKICKKEENGTKRKGMTTSGSELGEKEGNEKGEEK